MNAFSFHQLQIGHQGFEHESAAVHAEVAVDVGALGIIEMVLGRATIGFHYLPKTVLW
jgi:hypothetical protein